MSQELQDLYSTADQVRSTFAGDEQRAARYFEDYLNFVARAAPINQGGTVLDIGCGAGWSTFLFAKQGYTATGIDLNEKAFEPPLTAGLKFLQASILEMPFEDESFDIVTTYQTIEHVPDTRRALLEMLRVCKPGGTVGIVGPNLVSLGQSLKEVRVACRNRPLSRVFVRGGGMPRHPYGNTLPETLISIPLTLGRILAKTLSPRARFTMRQPDLIPPFHADNDACYLCNPIDLVKFLPKNGCGIIQNGAYGRPGWTASLAGGTWIAARKQAKS